MADPAGGDGFLTLEKLVGALAAVVSAAFWWGWNHIHRRVDTARSDMDKIREELAELKDSKADKTELDRQRDHVAKIFDLLSIQGQTLAKMEAKLNIVCRHFGKGE